MKTYGLLALFALLLSMFVPDSGPSSTDSLPYDVYLNIGNAIEYCTGSGICGMSAIAIRSRSKAKGRFTIDGRDARGNFRLQSLRLSEFSENARKEFFSGSHFIMEESFSTNQTINGVTGNLVIKKGKYKLSPSGSGFIITFND